MMTSGTINTLNSSINDLKNSVNDFNYSISDNTIWNGDKWERQIYRPYPTTSSGSILWSQLQECFPAPDPGPTDAEVDEAIKLIGESAKRIGGK